jgi:hypothetical protein
MKIVWKGKYISKEQLPIVILPSNAVKFKEPSTFLTLNLFAGIFVIPVTIIVGTAFYIKTLLGLTVDFYDMFDIWGMLIALIMIIPHEFLHAIAFPKQAEVQIWYSIKNMMLFAYSTYPTSKLRFIYSSLLPSIIFGVVPLMAWFFIPNEFFQASKTIFSFASFSLILGIGDFLNVYNAAIQMPRNSIIQLSGFHSYWYLQ